MTFQEEASAGSDDPSPTWQLFQSLSVLESITFRFAEMLQRYQEKWAESPPSDDFRYSAPPDKYADAELREMIEVEREALLRSDTTVHRVEFEPGKVEEFEIKSTDRFWRKDLDHYHRLYREFDKRVQACKLKAKNASAEIDQRDTSVVDLYSTRIVLDLQNLGGTVPPPLMIGKFEPRRAGRRS